MNKIAVRLRRARERLGETQGTFAKRFGVARTTLLNWEQGNIPPDGSQQLLINYVLAELAVAHSRQAAE